MKNPGEEKTRRDRGRRAKKSAHPLPRSLPFLSHVELPEPPVLPDVYTKDRRSIHPTRKQQPETSVQEKRRGERLRRMRSVPLGRPLDIFGLDQFCTSISWTGT